MNPGRVVVTVKVELPTFSVKEALTEFAPKIVEGIETMRDERSEEIGRPYREPPRVKGVNVVKR